MAGRGLQQLHVPEEAGGAPLGWEIWEQEKRRLNNRGPYVLGYRVHFDGEAESQLHWLPKSLLTRSLTPLPHMHAHTHSHTLAQTRSPGPNPSAAGGVWSQPSSSMRT